MEKEWEGWHATKVPSWKQTGNVAIPSGVAIFLSLFLWLWHKATTLPFLTLSAKAPIGSVVFRTGATAINKHNTGSVWIAVQIGDVGKLLSPVSISSVCQVCVCVLTLRRISLVLRGERSSKRDGSRPSTPQLCAVCSCNHTNTHSWDLLRPRYLGFQFPATFAVFVMLGNETQ